MTLIFDRLTFQLSFMSDVALFTLLIYLFGSALVDLMSKFTLELVDDLYLNKMSHYRMVSGVVLGAVARVVGSNLARGKIFTASIGSVDSLYPSVFIYCL